VGLRGHSRYNVIKNVKLCNTITKTIGFKKEYF
jgi:hypothetical protein